MLKKVQEKLMLGQSRLFTKRTYRRARGPVFSLRQKERKRRGRKDHTQYESKHKPNENRCSEKEGTSFLFGAKGAFGLSVSMLCILSLPK